MDVISLLSLLWFLAEDSTMRDITHLGVPNSLYSAGNHGNLLTLTSLHLPLSILVLKSHLPLLKTSFLDHILLNILLQLLQAPLELLPFIAHLPQCLSRQLLLPTRNLLQLLQQLHLPSRHLKWTTMIVLPSAQEIVLHRVCIRVQQHHERAQGASAALFRAVF